MFFQAVNKSDRIRTSGFRICCLDNRRYYIDTSYGDIMIFYLHLPIILVSIYS